MTFKFTFIFMQTLSANAHVQHLTLFPHRDTLTKLSWLRVPLQPFYTCSTDSPGDKYYIHDHLTHLQCSANAHLKYHLNLWGVKYCRTCISTVIVKSGCTTNINSHIYCDYVKGFIEISFDPLESSS